jgi:hypothetical protein
MMWGYDHWWGEDRWCVVVGVIDRETGDFFECFFGEGKGGRQA